MEQNNPAPPQPVRNPVDQAFAWIRFGVDNDRDSIRQEGGFDAFDDFVGFAGSNIWPPALPRGPSFRDASILECVASSTPWALSTGCKMKAVVIARHLK